MRYGSGTSRAMALATSPVCPRLSALGTGNLRTPHRTQTTAWTMGPLASCGRLRPGGAYHSRCGVIFRRLERSAAHAPDLCRNLLNSKCLNLANQPRNGTSNASSSSSTTLRLP